MGESKRKRVAHSHSDGPKGTAPSIAVDHSHACTAQTLAELCMVARITHRQCIRKHQDSLILKICRRESPPRLKPRESERRWKLKRSGKPTLRIDNPPPLGLRKAAQSVYVCIEFDQRSFF